MRRDDDTIRHFASQLGSDGVLGSDRGGQGGGVCARQRAKSPRVPMRAGGRTKYRNQERSPAQGPDQQRPTLPPHPADPAARPAPRQHVLHIGAGTGYYTAVLAELVGSAGRVTAFEVDKAVAARARRNLGAWPQVRVIHGDALATPFDPADGITVNAGATRPPAAWLDALRPGGRMTLPLTTDEGWCAFDPAKIARRGAVFPIERDNSSLAARRAAAAG